MDFLSGPFLCRPEHKGADNGRKPENNTKDTKDVGKGEGGCEGICKDEEAEEDGENAQDSDAPTLAGKCSI